MKYTALALAIFCSGPPDGLNVVKIAEVPKVPDIAKAGPTVPVSAEVAAVVTGEGVANELKVKETPSTRLRKYLLDQPKASKTTCTQESKNEKAEPVQSLEVKTAQDHPAMNLLPPKPSDWVEGQTPVSADQQVVPKPRGRKKKVAGDGQTSTETPASAAPKPKAAAKRKGKAKVNAEEKVSATGSRGSKRKPEHTPHEYEPLEVEGEVGMDKSKAFDSYAAACAKADIHKLLHGTETDADPETNPKKRDSEAITTEQKTNQPKKRAKAALTSSEGDDKAAEDIKAQETKERKARLSRKSVAYKREYKANPGWKQRGGCQGSCQKSFLINNI